eukprot:12070143-Karenia_brevis.AAC.1
MAGLHVVKDDAGIVHTAPLACANILASFWLPIFSSKGIDMPEAKATLAEVVSSRPDWDWSLK